MSSPEPVVGGDSSCMCRVKWRSEANESGLCSQPVLIAGQMGLMHRAYSELKRVLRYLFIIFHLVLFFKSSLVDILSCPVPPRVQSTPQKLHRRACRCAIYARPPLTCLCPSKGHLSLCSTLGC